MATLLSTCTSESGNIQHISPQNAGWAYVGFDVWELKAGESIPLSPDERERCLMLLAGLASLQAADSFLNRVGQRMSPVHRMPV
ncbi:5-deoxy-glucuronate isomerase, partial [Salmonella enterica]|uniref:5-deoxy-glucuronate isomerase n=1 Tax=Salmonella enterica TaxID=28901 RepID=UPI003211A31C